HRRRGPPSGACHARPGAARHHGRHAGAVLGARPAERRAVQSPVARLAPYGLLAPCVIFLAIFFAWPMLQVVVLAFQDASGTWSLAPAQRMLGDLRFAEALKLTLVFAGLVIPLQTLLALGMALLLATNMRGAGIFLYV